MQIYTIDNIPLIKDNIVRNIQLDTIYFIIPSHNIYQSTMYSYSSIAPDLHPKKQLKEEIKTQIETLLEGATITEQEKKIFYTQGNTTYPIEICSSGVNAVAPLILACANGTINSDTLIIIDEPETYLHPPWIVEYAKLIILLQKHYNCTFLIASHHPDMVSALKGISEKELPQENINFYMAERAENYKETYQYEFKSQGQSIQKIFSSYNRAIDKIDEYRQ